MWPGAVYVDVGPRQTGSRLLQANHVDPDRTLRMDDREDPASQPIRIAFKLLSLGFSVDESSLMNLAAQPRQTSWVKGRRGRLPYLVNGHAAIPLDGRHMPPSPLVPVLTPHNEEKRTDVMPEPGSDRLLDVYAEYQKTMRKFLESQDQVFAALTGGSVEVRPVPLPQADFSNGSEAPKPVSIPKTEPVQPAAPAPVIQPSPSQPSSGEPTPAVATVSAPVEIAPSEPPSASGAFSNQQHAGLHY